MNMVFQPSRYTGTLSKSETRLFIRIQTSHLGFGEGWGGADPCPPGDLYTEYMKKLNLHDY